MATHDTASGMNLRRIEAFLAVADARSISRAAAQIEVAQSVVSRHVAAFETQLGCRLFERTGRGVALTPAGERLAPRLRAALDEMELAAVEAAEVGDEPSGVVKLGVVPSTARPLVGMLHQRVAARYPRIRLQFVEGFSNSLDEMLADGRIDLAVINRFGHVARRGEEALCSVDSVVIGAPGAFSKGQELTFHDLAQCPLVLPARPNALRVVLDRPSKQAGVQLHVAVESDSLLIMKDLIVQAGLFTVLARQAMHEEIELGLLSAARLVKPTVPRVLSLVSSVKRPGTAATRTVARGLREIVQHVLLRKM